MKAEGPWEERTEPSWYGEHARHANRVPVLVVVHPTYAQHALSRRCCVVAGRSPKAGVRLSDGEASREHCRFDVNNNRVRLTDCESLNGTFVNGRQVTQRELAPGDVVRIGNTLIVLVYSAPDTKVVTRMDGSGMVTGAALQSTLRQAEAIAQADVPVIVRGESGTGKELVAKFIHQKSQRSGPFVAVNCAAMPEGLAESYFFGHQRGAFTGADNNHVGVLRQAHLGTLLLDEVGDLPLPVQAKLLRFLEDGMVVPLGASAGFRSDVRVVAAGHHSLPELVALKRFRGDLYARLNGVELHLVPLRNRREETLALFRSAFERFGGGTRPTLSTALAEALLIRRWPYNVREVVQLARHMAALHGGRSVLRLSDAPKDFGDEPAPSEPPAESDPGLSPVQALRKERHLAEFDRLHAALKESGGNLSRAARIIGISRGRAYRLMKPPA